MFQWQKHLWLLMASAVLASILAAQQTTGAVRGVLTDNSGAVIPGASVSVVGNGVERAAGTQIDGTFSITGLMPGQYTVHVAFPGFNPFDRNVNVSSGTAVQVPITLLLTAERQQVTVQADAGPNINVEPDNNATSLVLRGQDLEALPDDPDDLADALQALAGPATGPNGTQVFVDGFSGGALPPKESIREIRINQNPFSAEFDKLGMGRIEILTRPGTDKYRGTLFLNDGNGVFNARNPYASNKPGYSNTMFGGNLSGPMGKHGSFFLNVDRRYIDNNAIIHATLLDPQTLLESPFNQAVLAPFRNTYVNPRFDYQLSTNHTLVGRYQYVTYAQDAAGIGQFSLPSRAYTSGTTEHTVQLTETAIVSPKAVNETRFEFSHTNTAQNGDNSIPTLLVSSAFIGGGAQVGHSYSTLEHFELQNYTTLSHNTHTFRFGVRLRRDALANNSPQNFGGTFTFFGVAVAPVLDGANQVEKNADGQPMVAPITSIEQYRRTLLFQGLGYPAALIHLLGGGASQFSLASGNPFTSLKQFDAGVFVQDDWRMRPNLTLSLGMRYETQTNIHDWRDFAPRVGVAWAPGTAKNGRQKTVIRAGFGMFYDRVAESLSLQALRFNRVTQQQYLIPNPDFYPNVPSTTTLNAQGDAGTWFQMDGNMRAPYLMQSAIGVERQLPANTSIALTFTNSHALHLLQTVNINTPLPGTGVQPYGSSLGNLFLFESGGIMNQNLLVFNFNTRPRRGIALFGNYSLNFSNSSVDNAGSPSNPYNFKQDYSRSLLERRHRFQVVGSLAAPLGLRVSPFVIIQSGTPYNLIVGQDLNGDTLPLDRPAFATDLSRKTVRVTPDGAFDAIPLAGQTIVPRNYLTGAGLISLNVRLARTFGFGSRNSANGAGLAGAAMRFGQGGGGVPGGGRIGDGSLAAGLLDGPSEKRFTVTISVIAANVINHVNPGGYVGALLSPQFGEPTMLNGGFGGGVGGGAFGSPANNRRLEFQTRLAF
jgi:hypothetical protein